MSAKRTGRKRRLTDEQIDEVRRSLELKNSMPTLRQWAKTHNMSESGLAFVLREGYKQYEEANQPEDEPG